MKLLKEVSINSLERLSEFSREFYQKLKPGMIVFLSGTLGSGKTTFVRYLVSELGITEAASPSFTLINEYRGGGQRFAHADFYRLKSAGELHEIGFYEYIDSGEFIVLIEWAELFKEALPEPDFILSFINESEDSRKVTVYES